MKHGLWSLLFIFIFISCAKTDEEEINSALREARYHLTSMDCSKAKEVLDEVGQQKDNADYVSVYASAIACEAGYTDLGTAINNLTNITTTTVGLLNSFAAFESSNETEADAATYSKIVEAIRYIVEADGGVRPNTNTRKTTYGTNDGNDLSMQALLMTTVAVGKYFAFYGNTDTNGIKGSGSVDGGSTCIGFYPFNALLNTDLADGDLDPSGISTNGCTSANSGHAQLDPGTIDADTVKRRMCEGIFLFNNLFEILENVDLATNDSLGEIDQVPTLINDILNAAQINESAATWRGSTTAVSDLRDETSLANCIAADDADIQKYFVLIFETGL